MKIVGVIVLAAVATAIAPQEWRQASREYPLAVPRDHVSHPAFKIEWWYYTGNLDTTGGRRFGYQATFFRIGVDLSPKNPSRFAVRDLFLAHAAVTDVEGKRYVSAERLNRAGAGTAGASGSELAVWNADWETRSEYGRHMVHARESRFAFDLTQTVEHCFAIDRVLGVGRTDPLVDEVDHADARRGRRGVIGWNDQVA